MFSKPYQTTYEKLSSCNINGEMILREWYALNGLSPSLGEPDNIYEEINYIVQTTDAYYFLNGERQIHMRLPHDTWERQELDGRVHFVSRNTLNYIEKDVCDGVSKLDAAAIRRVLAHVKDRLEVIENGLGAE